MNTATFKIKTEHKAITEVVLPVPSYYKSDRSGNYVKVHSASEITRVSLGGMCPRIEFDDFFGFTPTGYVQVSEEEFTAAYNECEAALRRRTFFKTDIQLTVTGS